MGLGIVEPKRQGTHVPATALLLQDDLTGTRRKDTNEVVLVPRPSMSPRDPLVHQRGKRIAFLNVMSLGPVNLSPIVSGYVADKYGWRTNFWIMTAFTAVALLLIFFAAPETSYNRAAIYDTDITSSDILPIREENITADVIAPVKEPGNDVSNPPADKELSSMEIRKDESPQSYWQELLPFRSLETRDNPIVLLARFFTCGLYPAVIWSFLVGGTYVAWFIALTVVVAQIFSPPPISYTPAQLGHLNAFPTVGAFVAFIIMGTLADSTAKYAARRNKGIYEPEFRLYLISFGLFIGVPGLALFGWYASTAAPGHMIKWVVMSFIYGMVIFTTVTQQSNTFAYLLDAHRNISVETAVFSVMLRNFFSFGAGKFLPIWLMKSGPANTFYAIAGIQAALVLTTVPLYLYGKVIREFYHRHNLFKLLHVDVEHRAA